MSLHVTQIKSTCRAHVASALLCFSTLSAVLVPTRADTPAQVQKAIQATCDHAAACYGRKDLTGAMSMFSPKFVLYNVEGRKVSFLQNQAGFANAFARSGLQSTGHCVISHVTCVGDRAQALVQWHYTARYARTPSNAAFTFTRSYEERAVWIKSAAGWREVSAQMTHDVMDYHRGATGAARAVEA